MSARVRIKVDGRAIEVAIRGVGSCSCGARNGVHEPDCGLLEPVGIDLVLDRPARERRPWWWRGPRRPWPRQRESWRHR